MRRTLLVSAALVAGFVVAGAAPAFAWQNSGSYTGPRGGMLDWTQGCGPHGQFCARSWSATTPNGQTYHGGGTIRHTPYGGHVSNRWSQGPNGNVYYGRRRW